MGWRTVIISNTAKLDYKMGYLCIRSNEDVKRIFIDEISVLIIENTNVSLTTYLLVELANKSVDIIFCDSKRCPNGVYRALYGSYDVSRSVRSQIAWTKESKMLVWQNIFCSKIKGQSAVLNYLGKVESSEKLLSYIPQVELGDATNREGHAAKVYFNSLFGMEFSRERNDDCSFINSALNYGYSILLSLIAREIVINGYLTQIGIFHDNIFNEFNLASDLMEPFRPFVDALVYKMDAKELDNDSKMKIVSFLNRKIKIDNREQYFANAVNIYVKTVLDAITNDNVSNMKFPDYDLSLYESISVL